MMMYTGAKKHRNVPYYGWGLLLFALWLSLHTVIFAVGEEIDLPEEVEIPAPTATSLTGKAERLLSGETKGEVLRDVRYAVDFPYLHTVAPNSVAWLYQPNTTINHAVMFSENPDYYLRRQFNGHLSPNGTIFMKGEEKPDFSAPVITIYGRNCLDFSLFGSFSYYQEAEYYQENPTFYLVTPQGEYQLDIFAGIRTKTSGDNSWQVSQNSAEILFSEDLPRILELSFLEPNPSFLPEKGEDWALLATEFYEKQGRTRYVMYARKRPMEGEVARVAQVNEIDMDSRETLNGRVSVENVGEWMLYAQNDPLWRKLVFEIQHSNKKRPFGDGGCGPTAVAIAIANLVEKEELPKLGDYASSPFGYRFCVCSVNDYWCSGKHLTYRLETPEEYERYLPLAVASFSTGNNIWDVRGRNRGRGTSMRYLENICQVFDIAVTQTYQIRDAFTFLEKENTIAVACTVGHGSPFTKDSHFLVLAGVDEEYLYVLDPMRREHYQNLDVKNYLEVLVPGLVRVKLEDATQCNLAPIYLLEKKS